MLSRVDVLDTNCVNTKTKAIKRIFDRATCIAGCSLLDIYKEMADDMNRRPFLHCSSKNKKNFCKSIYNYL